MTLNRHGFTFIEFLVLMALFILAIAIVLPFLNINRRTARSTINITQGSSIYFAMVTYAQGNNTRFPGLLDTGAADIPAVTASESVFGYDSVAWDASPTSAMRVGVMLNSNYFTPDNVINPSDPDVQQAVPNTTLTSNSQSYAWLEIAETSTGRKSEWRETLNAKAIVLSDRNTASDTADPAHASSVWTVVNSGNWRGMVVWNDGHTTFETNAIITSDTHYGDGPVYTPADTQAQYLFNAASTDDVYVTRSGQ